MNRKREPMRINEFALDVQDLRASERAAQLQKREYNRKQPQNFKKPIRARFKALIYFTDGEKRTRYSLDKITTANGAIYDEWKGLTALQKMITDYGHKVLTAKIYANVSPIPLTESRAYDLEIKKKTQYHLHWFVNVQFKVDQDGNNSAVFKPLTKIIKKPRLND